MRQFKLQGRVLYLAQSRDARTHFVPNVNWEDYIAHRFNCPSLCIIYDTIEEAQQEAIKSIH